MEYSQLKGRPVVAVNTADTLGHVEDGVLTQDGTSFAGLKINLTGLFSGASYVHWGDIYGIGANAVTLKEGDILKDPARAEDLKNLPSVDGIIGDTVMSEYGTDLGTVGDIDLDGETGTVISLVLKEGVLGALTHRTRSIPIAEVQSIGRDRVTVTEGSVKAE